MPKVTLKESDRTLAARNRARAMAMASARDGAPRLDGAMSGMGFEANDPRSLKMGIMAMEQQLKDMEAHPNRYIQALKNGYCIAGFGGDLFGIEVPETLMYGKVPAGTTPAQAFQQVIDYMRQVIAAARNKLPNGSSANTKAFRAPAGLLESVDRLIISTGSWGSYKK